MPRRLSPLKYGIFVAAAIIAINPFLATAVYAKDIDCDKVEDFYISQNIQFYECGSTLGTTTTNGCSSILLQTIVDPVKLAEVIDKYIDDVADSYNGKKSPMDGLGKAFVEGGIANGINPFIGVVHAHKESLFGTYSAKGWHNYTFATKEAAAAKDESKLSDSFNAYGRAAGGSQPTVWYPGSNGPRPVFKWQSWADSLTGTDSFFTYYKRKWVEEEKLTSIEDIIKKYAPSSDGNDPTGYAAFMRDNIQKLTDAAGAALDCGSGGESNSTGAGGTGGSKIRPKTVERVNLAYGYNLTKEPKMIYYSQDDDRWQNDIGRRIYPNGDSSRPVGECGCFITNMAMAINTVGPDKTVTPLNVGVVAKKQGSITNGCGYTGGAAGGEKLAKEFNVSIKSITTMGEAKEGLRAGGLVVISMGPSAFTSGRHYITLRGVAENGEFAVVNSIGSKLGQSLNETFTAKYIDDHGSNEDGRMWVISAK